MPYMIGIGALIEGQDYNHIRKIELDIADRVGSYEGLSQSPNVTIKRPFAVDDLMAVVRAKSSMRDVALNSTSFNITLDGVSTFDAAGVIYLQVADNKELYNLHKRCLASLMDIFPQCKNMFDGDGVKFHSSLAMNLSPDKLQTALKYLHSEPESVCRFNTRIDRLGLFLRVDDGPYWTVIDTVKMG